MRPPVAGLARVRDGLGQRPRRRVLLLVESEPERRESLVNELLATLEGRR